MKTVQKIALITILFISGLVRAAAGHIRPLGARIAQRAAKLACSPTCECARSAQNVILWDMGPHELDQELAFQFRRLKQTKTFEKQKSVTETMCLLQWQKTSVHKKEMRADQTRLFSQGLAANRYLNPRCAQFMNKIERYLDKISEQE